MDFQDRVAFVTGAASGMGQALCRQLGSAGARLGLVDRDEEGLARLRKELTEAGFQAATAVADVRKREQVHAAFDSLTQQLGPADILMPCAGICALTTVEDLNVPLVEAILQVNYLGVIYAIESVLPAMLERGSGHIACIASMAAHRGIPFEAAYCASKAALVAYLESLRPALRRRGVVVTTIFPGFVQTPLLDGLLTAGKSKAPGGVVNAEFAARKILAAVRRERRVVSFPWSTRSLVWLGRMLPHWLYDRVMTRMASRVDLPY
jgi:short-subunit dehydrogenase